MTDRLGEALAEFESSIQLVLARYPDAPGLKNHLVIVAAARSWHTLTNPTDELIEQLAKALYQRVTQQKWKPNLSMAGVYREDIRVVLDALSDTAEEESEADPRWVDPTSLGL